MSDQNKLLNKKDGKQNPTHSSFTFRQHLFAQGSNPCEGIFQQRQSYRFKSYS